MGSLIDSKIAKCRSWEDFEKLASVQQNTKDKGDLFERLTQLYLQTSPTYASKIKHVWWCNNPYTSELPENIRQKLRLPDADEGIDLICETFEGKYWSVQAKYRTDTEKRLNTKELSKFLSLSFVTSGGIELGLIAHTSSKAILKQRLMGNTTELGLQNFLEISSNHWERIAEVCERNSLRPPTKRDPHPFQQPAVLKASEYFSNKQKLRGKLIMPCGSGKSLIAFWIAQKLDAKNIVLAVPSLALVKQSIDDWTSELLARGVLPEWLAVCSDESVGNMKEADSTVSTVYEAGIPTTTNELEIIKFLKKETDAPKIIFTTYQSGQVLADASLETGFQFDLLIADEAHKTVGEKDSSFAYLLLDENIKISKRLFMTATERVIKGDAASGFLTMDDSSIYGELIHRMSFREAIEAKAICDYKILTLFVPSGERETQVKDREIVQVEYEDKKIQTDAHHLAVGIALEKAFEEYGIRKVITFHNSIKKAENFIGQQVLLGRSGAFRHETNCEHISSKQSAGHRSRALDKFAKQSSGILSNARCLTEGVDVPSVDCVAFVDPKQSVIDIVQAAGRAMRRSDETGKKLGYILIPISVPEGQNIEDIGETTNFKAVCKIITALSTQDERIAEELKLGSSFRGDGAIIIDDSLVPSKNLVWTDFENGIRAEIWKSVARANWLKFEDARELARSYNLKGKDEYFEFSSLDLRPLDLPSNPDREYRYSGWAGWGDFLGTKHRRGKSFVSFHEAKKYAISLNLTGQTSWFEHVRSGLKPLDIPANPPTHYRDKGWAGWRDFLGTTQVKREQVKRKQVKRTAAEKAKYFINLREFVIAQGLQSNSEYRNWRKSSHGVKEFKLPSNPDKEYRDYGWAGWGDFLGTGNVAKKTFLPFEEAREVARSLQLTGKTHWEALRKTKERPANIPALPSDYYKDSGWAGWGDFLGTGNVVTKTFLPFEEARSYVRKLNLKKSLKWKEFASSSERPENIPSNPQTVYKEKGWVNFKDWLNEPKWTREDK